MPSLGRKPLWLGSSPISPPCPASRLASSAPAIGTTCTGCIGVCSWPGRSHAYAACPAASSGAGTPAAVSPLETDRDAWASSSGAVLQLRWAVRTRPSLPAAFLPRSWWFPRWCGCGQRRCQGGPPGGSGWPYFLVMLHGSRSIVYSSFERSKWLEGGVNSLFKISTNFTKQVS